MKPRKLSAAELEEIQQSVRGTIGVSGSFAGRAGASYEAAETECCGARGDSKARRSPAGHARRVGEQAPRVLALRQVHAPLRGPGGPRARHGFKSSEIPSWSCSPSGRTSTSSARIAASARAAARSWRAPGLTWAWSRRSTPRSWRCPSKSARGRTSTSSARIAASARAAARSWRAPGLTWAWSRRSTPRSWRCPSKSARLRSSPWCPSVPRWSSRFANAASAGSARRRANIMSSAPSACATGGSSSWRRAICRLTTPSS